MVDHFAAHGNVSAAILGWSTLVPEWTRTVDVARARIVLEKTVRDLLHVFLLIMFASAAVCEVRMIAIPMPRGLRWSTHSDAQPWKLAPFRVTRDSYRRR